MYASARSDLPVHGRSLPRVHNWPWIRSQGRLLTLVFFFFISTHTSDGSIRRVKNLYALS